VGEVTGEIVDEFVHLARCDFEQGRIKEWKRKLLRKAALLAADGDGIALCPVEHLLLLRGGQGLPARWRQ